MFMFMLVVLFLILLQGHLQLSRKKSATAVESLSLQAKRPLCQAFVSILWRVTKLQKHKLISAGRGQLTKSAANFA